MRSKSARNPTSRTAWPHNVTGSPMFQRSGRSAARDHPSNTPPQAKIISPNASKLQANVAGAACLLEGLSQLGPGAGEVASSHIGSLLLCLSGVGCLADIEVQDFTDNGQAVANGIFDSIDIPPGTYQLGLIADSAVISRDEGSSLGGAEFSGYIAVEPLPEPGPGAMWLAGIAFLATRQRSRARGR